MSTERSNPPALAIWFLQRLYPEWNRDAITGDLLERFREGRSRGWFWRQALVAILVGSARQWRLPSAEICFAAAGTALIWCVPWGRIFPIDAITAPSMNWSARFLWSGALEITTAMTILPFFAVLFSRWRTFAWANLLLAFFISAMLITVADLGAIWLSSWSQAAWVVPMMLEWIFAALLISARLARRFPGTRRSTG
jgi:hypothetical protein